MGEPKMGQLCLGFTMIGPKSLLIICLLVETSVSAPSPNVLDTVNIHLYFGEDDTSSALPSKPIKEAKRSDDRSLIRGGPPVLPTHEEIGSGPPVLPTNRELGSGPPVLPSNRELDGDAINEGNTCGNVTCTGKRSSVTIICCQNQNRRKH